MRLEYRHRVDQFLGDYLEPTLELALKGLALILVVLFAGVLVTASLGVAHWAMDLIRVGS